MNSRFLSMADAIRMLVEFGDAYEVARNNQVDSSDEKLSLPVETEFLMQNLEFGASNHEPPIAHEQLLMAVIAFGDSYVLASVTRIDEKDRLRESTQMLLAILTDQAAGPGDVEKVFPYEEVLSDA